MAGGLSSSRRRELERLIETAIIELHEVLRAIDPIHLPPMVFDPANPVTFAEAIGNKLMVQDELLLEKIDDFRFYGSGVYAIYYKGNFGAYKPVSGTATPIYVGKADPPKSAKSPKEQGDKLWSRIREHLGSIREVETYCNANAIKGNLKVANFTFRYLVTVSGWQPAAEAYLISLFSPIWNKETKVVQGIGKHGDASDTRANERSRWDTLHPGRDWATHEGNKPNRLSSEQIKELVLNHFKQFPPKHL
jgi:hypothetical protein